MPEHRACDSPSTTLKPERVQLRLVPAGSAPPLLTPAEHARLRRLAAAWQPAARGGLARTFELPAHPQAVLFTTAAHSLAEVVGLDLVASVEGSRVDVVVTAAEAASAPGPEPSRRSLDPDTHTVDARVLLGALACDAVAGLWGATS